MNIKLDKIVITGEVFAAAIVEHAVEPFTHRAGVAVHCAKQPLVILVRRNDITKAFDAIGNEFELEDIEQRYPSQCESFEALTAELADRPG